MDRMSVNREFCETFYVSFEKDDIVFEGGEVLNCDDIYEDSTYRQVVRQGNDLGRYRSTSKPLANSSNVNVFDTYL